MKQHDKGLKRNDRSSVLDISHLNFHFVHRRILVVCPWLRSAQNPWLRTALFAFSFSVLAACSELQATYKADSRIQWNPQLRNRLLTCVAFSMLLALAFLLGDSPYAFALLVLALILVIGYQIHLRRLSTTIASVWACTAVAAYLMYRFYR